MTDNQVKSASETRRAVAEADYRHFMLRELLIWLVGVPVPIAAIIGFFVL